MRVFISWHGEPSRSIARSLRQALWLEPGYGKVVPLYIELAPADVTGRLQRHQQRCVSRSGVLLVRRFVS
jgi:hypothetical protein